MSKCIFITATGTDIGKTFVTALIVKKLASCASARAITAKPSVLFP